MSVFNPSYTGERVRERGRSPVISHELSRRIQGIFVLLLVGTTVYLNQTPGPEPKDIASGAVPVDHKITIIPVLATETPLPTLTATATTTTTPTATLKPAETRMVTVPAVKPSRTATRRPAVSVSPTPKKDVAPARPDKKTANSISSSPDNPIFLTKDQTFTKPGSRGALNWFSWEPGQKAEVTVQTDGDHNQLEVLIFAPDQRGQIMGWLKFGDKKPAPKGMAVWQDKFQSLHWDGANGVTSPEKTKVENSWIVLIVEKDLQNKTIWVGIAPKPPGCSKGDPIYDAHDGRAPGDTWFTCTGDLGGKFIGPKSWLEPSFIRKDTKNQWATKLNQAKRYSVRS